MYKSVISEGLRYKKTLLKYFQKGLIIDGAEEGIRTPDPNLGKVRYAHFNPNRINLNITE